MSAGEVAALVCIVVGAFFYIVAKECLCRVDQEAQEPGAAGRGRAAPTTSGGGRRAPPPSSLGRAGGRAVARPPPQQPAAPVAAVEMVIRSKQQQEALVSTYQRADGWPEATCAVCLAELDDGVNVRVLPVCMHYFHASCVGEWLLTHHTCPLCRAPLDPGAGAS
ncbi:hypothetical protein BS78_05G284100 [Paspalum vaginatum]|nr:hypothetical protein BS78_05G284100 [Paspalum vaginatum]